MKDDDQSREKKLKELRSELESEFTRLHQQQLNEIERTEKRLQTLRAVHEKRQENKDNIVDRRIDQLLGKADPLGWNPAPLYHAPKPNQPVPADPDATRRSMPAPENLPRTRTPGTSNAFPNPGNNETGKHYGYQTPIGQPGPPHIPLGYQPAQPVHPGLNGNPGVGRMPGSTRSRTTLSTSPETAAQARRVHSGQPDAGGGAAPDELSVANSSARLNVSAPRSPLGEVFHLARSAADANAELAAAEIEYQQFKKLRDQRAISILEFQKAELKYEKGKRDVKLIQMQMKALLESMQRAYELAESTLDRASLKLDTIKRGHQNGVNTDQELSDATFGVKEAKIALVEASEVVEKLKETMATVQSFGNRQTNDDPAQDAPGSRAAPDAKDGGDKDPDDPPAEVRRTGIKAMKLASVRQPLPE